MALVSVRLGVGKSTLIAGPLAVFFGGCAIGAWRAAREEPEHADVLLLVAGAFALCSAVNALFALVHPDRVLALDDDDPPDRQVGDRAE